MARSPVQGLTEYVLVLALLSILAAGAVARFRDPIREVFGAAPASAPAAAGSPSRR